MRQILFIHTILFIIISVCVWSHPGTMLGTEDDKVAEDLNLFLYKTILDTAVIGN